MLAGDGRLTEALARDELLPLGTRIRVRLPLDYASRDELAACLDHLLSTAGAPTLLSPTLKHTLCERAGGNYRVMTNLAAQLLAVAAQRELPTLDDKLYLEVFAPPGANTSIARRTNRAR